MRKITILLKTTFLILFLFGFITRSYSQVPPTTSCSSNDLALVGAFLVNEGDACLDCDSTPILTKTLNLQINNTTGSTRTSFAFWGVLEIYSGDDGTLVSSMDITGCNGPLPPNEIKTLSFDEIEYDCGDILIIKELWLAWTEASPGSICDLDPNDIHPKCGKLSTLTIDAGVNGEFDLTDSQCGTPNGAIDLSPIGGKAPYTFLWSTIDGNIPSGSENSEDLTGLIPGTYSVIITDGDGCEITKTRTINTTAIPDAPSGTDVTVCYDGAEHTVSASAETGENIIWYTTETGNETTSPPSETEAGTYSAYVGAKIIATECESSNRTLVTLTINPLPVGTNIEPTIDSGNTLNEILSDNVDILGSTFSWQATENSNIEGETISESTASIITDILTNLTGVVDSCLYCYTKVSIRLFWGSIYNYSSCKS